MSRLPLVDPDTATGPARDLLAAAQKRLGAIPNMAKAMAHSPALLNSYLGLSASLAAGTLPLAVRERLALTVSEQNGCSFCPSAHAYVATDVALLDTARQAFTHGLHLTAVVSTAPAAPSSPRSGSDMFAGTRSPTTRPAQTSRPPPPISTRQYCRPCGRPWPRSDVAMSATHLGSMTSRHTHSGRAEAVVSLGVEVEVVGVDLDRAGTWWYRVLRRAVARPESPVAVARLVAGIAGDQEDVLLHSTSWRHTEDGTVVLTFLACPDQRAATLGEARPDPAVAREPDLPLRCQPTCRPGMRSRTRSGIWPSWSGPTLRSRVAGGAARASLRPWPGCSRPWPSLSPQAHQSLR